VLFEEFSRSFYWRLAGQRNAAQQRCGNEGARRSQAGSEPFGPTPASGGTPMWKGAMHDADDTK
jgi:hypothetical protein